MLFDVGEVDDCEHDWSEATLDLYSQSPFCLFESLSVCLYRAINVGGSNTHTDCQDHTMMI